MVILLLVKRGNRQGIHRLDLGLTYIKNKNILKNYIFFAIYKLYLNLIDNY